MAIVHARRFDNLDDLEVCFNRLTAYLQSDLPHVSGQHSLGQLTTEIRLE
jgi:hypothetical protein